MLDKTKLSVDRNNNQNECRYINADNVEVCNVDKTKKKHTVSIESYVYNKNILRKKI